LIYAFLCFSLGWSWCSELSPNQCYVISCEQVILRSCTAVWLSSSRFPCVFPWNRFLWSLAAVTQLTSLLSFMPAEPTFLQVASVRPYLKKECPKGIFVICSTINNLGKSGFSRVGHTVEFLHTKCKQKYVGRVFCCFSLIKKKNSGNRLFNLSFYLNRLSTQRNTTSIL
jgi:hypothetical protein